MRKLFNLFRLPTVYEMRREQLEQAEREHFAWVAQREYAQHMEAYYAAKLGRLRAEKAAAPEFQAPPAPVPPMPAWRKNTEAGRAFNDNGPAPDERPPMPMRPYPGPPLHRFSLAHEDPES